MRHAFRNNYFGYGFFGLRQKTLLPGLPDLTLRDQPPVWSRKARLVFDTSDKEVSIRGARPVR